MPARETPDLSHLTGPEIERVATALTSAHIRTIIDRREDLKELKTDEMSRLVDLAAASRANCGGFGCG